jgi:hypothetical protein
MASDHYISVQSRMYLHISVIVITVAYLSLEFEQEQRTIKAGRLRHLLGPLSTIVCQLCQHSLSFKLSQIHSKPEQQEA